MKCDHCQSIFLFCKQAWPQGVHPIGPPRKGTILDVCLDFSILLPLLVLCLGTAFLLASSLITGGGGFANMIRDLRAPPSVHSVPSLLSNPQRGFCGGGGVGQSNIDQKHFHLQRGEKDNMADGLRGQNRWAAQGHRALSGESTRRTQHQARAETTEAPHMPPLLKPWRGTQWVRVFVNSYPHTHATRYAYPGPVSITVGEPTPAVSVPKRMYQNPLPTAPVLRPQTLGVP